MSVAARRLPLDCRSSWRRAVVTSGESGHAIEGLSGVRIGETPSGVWEPGRYRCPCRSADRGFMPAFSPRSIVRCSSYNVEQIDVYPRNRIDRLRMPAHNRKVEMNACSVVFEMSPDKVDDAVSEFEDRVISRFREIAGYEGFALLVNRENGKTFGVSFWESEDGVNASGDLGAEARQALADTAGASAQSPEVWEVAVDDRQ
ncbi:MAG: hypothetical protein ACR2IP_02240 [Solirubrobacteraceae bacterium]